MSAIALRKVSVTLGGRRVVSEVTATVEEGEWVALIGPNGAGKTSLLRAVAGLLPCDGTVSLLGTPLEALGRRGDRAAELSRGMLQRLALARVSLHRPSIVLLDEPTAALDAEGRDVLRRFLAEPGRTIVVATHEPAWFDGLGGRVVAMAAGRVAA